LCKGLFVIRDAKNVVLLAGGTGITAFIAFIEAQVSASHNKVFLAYGARKPELLLYRNLIDAKVGADNGFKALYFVETDENNSISNAAHSQSPECLNGCLSLEDESFEQRDILVEVIFLINLLILFVFTAPFSSIKCCHLCL
jgi:ferredoxin-NADP reductase